VLTRPWQKLPFGSARIDGFGTVSKNKDALCQTHSWAHHNKGTGYSRIPEILIICKAGEQYIAVVFSATATSLISF
jgi:hypothetical protein